MIISILNQIASTIWLLYVIGLPFGADRRGWDSPAGRLHEWLCIPALISWGILCTTTPQHWYNWPLNGLGLVIWYALHKMNHNHKKRKKLLEAGRGLVKRFYNRLIVTPEPSPA